MKQAALTLAAAITITAASLWPAKAAMDAPGPGLIAAGDLGANMELQADPVVNDINNLAKQGGVDAVLEKYEGVAPIYFMRNGLSLEAGRTPKTPEEWKQVVQVGFDLDNARDKRTGRTLPIGLSTVPVPFTPSSSDATPDDERADAGEGSREETVTLDTGGIETKVDVANVPIPPEAYASLDAGPGNRYDGGARQGPSVYQVAQDMAPKEDGSPSFISEALNQLRGWKETLTNILPGNIDEDLAVQPAKPGSQICERDSGRCG